MNKARRKKIDDIIKALEAATPQHEKLKEELEDFKSQIEDLRDQVAMVKEEESKYHENMPENMKYGDKGSTSENAVSELDSAHDLLDSFVNDGDLDGLSFVNDGDLDSLNLEDVIGHLDNAKQ